MMHQMCGSAELVVGTRERGAAASYAECARDSRMEMQASRWHSSAHAVQSPSHFYPDDWPAAMHKLVAWPVATSLVAVGDSRTHCSGALPDPVGVGS